MSLNIDLLERQISGRQVYKRPFIHDLSCLAPDGTGTIITNAGALRPSPVFYLEYAKHYSNLLASSDEEGYISVIDTGAPLPPSLEDGNGNRRCRGQWMAHRNAIFDFTWTKSDTLMYTGSGDQTVALWDTGYATRIRSFRGHTGSVKALAASPTNNDIVASGARDGCLMVWDSRTENGRNIAPGVYQAPVLCIEDAHKPAPTGHARKTLCGKPRPTTTSVKFLPAAAGNIIASAGVDGCVKLWDLRRADDPLAVVAPATDIISAKKKLAKQQQAGTVDSSEWGSVSLITQSPPPNLGLRDHGITSLSLHPETCQLLVSLTGGHLLLYDGLRPELGPTRWFGGHTISSFYVKAAYSPDGSHVVCGSSDGDTYIWQVDDADGTEPYILHGHMGEVTCPAWSPSDFSEVASAADDCTIKVWKLQRQQLEEKRAPKVAKDAYRSKRLQRVEELLARASSAGSSADGIIVQAAEAAGNKTQKVEQRLHWQFTTTEAFVNDNHAIENLNNDANNEPAVRDENQQHPIEINRTPLPAAIHTMSIAAAAGTTAPTTAAATGNNSNIPGTEYNRRTATTGGVGERSDQITLQTEIRGIGRLTSTGPPRRMAVSNALKSKLHCPQFKRTKQQTLVEALQGAASGGGGDSGGGDQGGGERKKQRVVGGAADGRENKDDDGDQQGALQDVGDENVEANR